MNQQDTQNQSFSKDNQLTKNSPKQDQSDENILLGNQLTQRQADAKMPPPFSPHASQQPTHSTQMSGQMEHSLMIRSVKGKQQEKTMREREREQILNNDKNTLQLSINSQLSQEASHHRKSTNASQLSHTQNIQQSSTDNLGNSSSKKNRHITELLNRTDEKQKPEQSLQEVGQMLQTQSFHGTPQYHNEVNTTQKNFRKYKKPVPKPSDNLTATNILGQMNTSYAAYDDFQNLIDKGRTQRMGTGLFPSRNAGATANQIIAGKQGKFGGYHQTGLMIPSMVQSDKTTTAAGGGATDSSQGNAMNVSNTGSFQQSHSNQEPSQVNKQLTSQYHLKKPGFIRKRKNSIFSNSNFSVANNPENVLQELNMTVKGTGNKEHYSWEVKFNNSNKKEDRHQTGAASTRAAQDLQQHRANQAQNIQAGFRTQNRGQSNKQKLIHKPGAFNPDRSQISNMTSNNSTIQNSPNNNLDQVFGKALQTKHDKSRSQTNKSKVQYRKFAQRQQGPTTTSYNTSGINDRENTMDPSIVNSGSSAIARRQVNQPRTSFGPNRTHNKINQPASISLDKKHADLMKNKKQMNQNQDTQVPQTNAELPRELIVSSYSKQMHDSHNQNQLINQKKSGSKFAQRFQNDLKQQNQEVSDTMDDQSFERDHSEFNTTGDHLDEKAKVFDYQNKQDGGEFFAKTSEAEFDEYFQRGTPLDQTQNMQKDGEPNQEQEMRNTFSDFAVSGINNPSEVNPSANPASSCGFDRTKKSEKITELSLKDLGDQDFEINNINDRTNNQSNLRRVLYNPQVQADIGTVQKSITSKNSAQDIAGPNNLYLQHSSSGNDQSSVVYRNQNLPQESTKNFMKQATFFSDEKMQDKMVNKSAANKIQKSQESRITINSAKLSGNVSVKTQTRFQNIVNKNQNIKQNLKMLKDNCIINESNSLFKKVVEDIKRAAKLTQQNSLTHSDIVNCIKASSFGSQSFEPPKTVNSNEIQNQFTIQGKNNNLIYKLNQNSDGWHQTQNGHSSNNKIPIKKSKSHVSIKRVQNFPMTIESYTDSPKQNGMFPQIPTRNKSLAQHNSCKQISKPNTNEQQYSDPSNNNQQQMKSPQLNLTNQKRLFGPANNIQDFTSKESSKNIFGPGKSQSVRSQNQMRSMRSLQSYKNINHQLYINPKGMEKSNNKPQDNQMVVGQRIQTQSNKNIQSIKSYVQSEKNFNSQEKLQNENLNPLMIINKNKEGHQNVYFTNQKSNEQLFQVSRSTQKMNMLFETDQNQQNGRPSHQGIILKGKVSSGGTKSDEKQNVMAAQMNKQFCNMQDLISEIQYDRNRRPSDPDYQPQQNMIVNLMSESGSSSTDNFPKHQRDIKGLHIGKSHQSQNFGNIHAIKLKMNQQRKVLNQINAASQSVKSQKYDTGKSFKQPSNQQKISFPSMKSDYNSGGKSKNSSGGSKEVKNNTKTYQTKYQKSSQVQLANKMQQNAAALGAGNLYFNAPQQSIFQKVHQPLVKGGIGGTSQNIIPHDAQRKPTEYGNIIKWREGDILGLGSSSIVYSAINTKDNSMIAVKKFKIVSDVTGVDQSKLKIVKNEIQKYKQLDHENIVKFFGCELLDQFFCIYLEQCQSSIANLLSEFGHFEESRIRTYTRQIVNGLQYLHSQKIKHLDLKCSNILTNNGKIVKLCDFGSAREFKISGADSGSGGLSIGGSSFTSLQSSVVGSVQWMAPEVIKEEGCGSKSDIWSLGCTVVEMFVGGNPWGDQIDEQNLYQAQQIIAHSDQIPQIQNQEVSQQCHDFLNKCFNRDRHKRPTALELLDHPWLAVEK